MILKAQDSVSTYRASSTFKPFFEKVFLHTDREYYEAGDTIWYKAYLVNTINNKPLGISENLIVELISIDSASLIEKETIRMSGGIGKGDFSLNDSIPGGKYKLRAYTRWMLNFNNTFIFEKDLYILNSQIPQANAIKLSKSISNPSRRIDQTPLTAITATVPDIRINFFPEGGLLVEDLSSLVAVKAENKEGKGIAIKGIVFDERKDTVTTFECDSSGFGLFALLPREGAIYKAKVTNVLNVTPVNLPTPLKKGPVMRVSNRDSLVLVSIFTKDTVKTGQELILRGSQRGKIYFEKPITPSAGIASAKISSTIFPEGIAAITLYDQEHRPLCERLVYISHTDTVPEIKIATDKLIYKFGDTVNVRIFTPGERAFLSLAALNASFSTVNVSNIISYLMLESEVKGKIEHPEKYFDRTNRNRQHQLDLLLLTQGWREFIWRKLADSITQIKYLPEKGITVSGKLLTPYSNKPLPGMNISLYVSAAVGNKLFSAVTKEDGSFLFKNIYFTGEQTLRLAAFNSKGERKGVFVLDTSPTLPLGIKVEEQNDDVRKTDLLAEVAQLLGKSQATLKSRKGKIKLNEVKVKAQRRYPSINGVFTSFGPGQSFNITEKDHEFKTLEWWLLQKMKGATTSPELPGVFFTGVDTFRVVSQNPFTSQNIVSYREKSRLIPPNFILDGKDEISNDSTYLNDYRNMLLNTPISKFKKIELKRVVGNLAFASELAAQMVMVDRFFIYLTTNGGLNLVTETGSLMPKVTGFYNDRNFYTPGTRDNTNADEVKATLFWQPFITTKAKESTSLSFVNNTSTSKGRIIVQGISENGKLFYEVREYTTKK